MRILHLCYDHPENPWGGGGQSRAWYEINRRLACNHDITVLTGGWSNAVPEQAVEGFRILTAGRQSNYIASRATYCWAAARMAREGNYDLLVDDMSAFAPNFAAWVARPRVAYVVLEPIHATQKAGLLGIPFRHYCRAALRRHSHVIAISKSLKQSIAQWTSSDCTIQVNPCGVDETLFELSDEDGDYALFLGRMDVYHKGLDLLLGAAERVKREVPDFKLIMAGRGRERAKVADMVDKSRLGKTVELLGPVSEERKRDLLRRARFVIMPSRHEGFGLVAVEAAACRKPVVGCRVTGLVDTVVNGYTGLLVAPEDTEQLASSIASVWQDTSLRLRLGSNAKKWAHNFTWDRAAVAQEKIYVEAVEEGSKV